MARISPCRRVFLDMPLNAPGMNAIVTAVASQKRKAMNRIGDACTRLFLTIVNVLPQITVTANRARSAWIDFGIFIAGKPC